MKKILIFTAALILTLIFAAISAAAEEMPASKAANTIQGGITQNMQDGNTATRSSVGTVSYTGESVRYIYIIFWNKPCNFTVKTADKEIRYSHDFLHYTVTLEELSDKFDIVFDESAEISEISFYTDGVLPSDVQNWQSNEDKADLVLFSTHADDEQLFFAGILPYYSKVKAYRVQVVYFADHKNNQDRRHELLNGLWTVGVTRYPVISPFLDQYSESPAAALSQIKYSGFAEDDIYKFQVEMLRRFKPLVIVEHDFNGEYGHGQHMLNVASMVKSVEYAADETLYPESFEKYGAWDTPKMYVHLYKENAISLDFIDVPSDKLGGKTPFQVTQDGFMCHKSQHWTWFKPWLLGSKGQITKASQIDTYSPLEFGLYRTKVGLDERKDDLFENVVNYAEQERIAEEERQRQLEEERRIAEESRKAEESRIAEESRVAEESRQAEQKRIDDLAKAEKRNKIIIAVCGATFIAVVIIFISVMSPKRRKRK